MKYIIQPTFIFLGMLLLGCVEKDDLCCVIDEVDQLSGKWRLYEVGYSTGFEYIKEAVSSKPAQTLTIGNNRVSSTVKGLERIRYYRVLNDSIVGTPYIALYANEPIGQTDSPSDSPTYSFEMGNNILTLYYRYCYEGCHMAFRKIE